MFARHRLFIEVGLDKKKIIKNQLEDVEATVWKDRNGGEASNAEVVIWAWDVAL